MDRFSRSVDRSNKAIDKNRTAMQAQSSQAASTGHRFAALAGEVTGASGAFTIGSHKASILARALAGVNLATGILEPALSGVLVAAGGLAAAFAAAGAGVAAYGVAAGPILSKVSELMKAQTTLDAARQKANQTFNASLASGTSLSAASAARTKQMQTAQAAYNQTMNQSPKPVRDFAKQVKSTKDAYDKWAMSLARPVLAPLSHALALVHPILRAITPLVKAAASAFDDLVGQLARNIKAGGLERVVKGLLPYVKPAIEGAVRSAANLAVGFAGILKAFLPVSGQIIGGLTNWTARFKNWGLTLSDHSGFRSLMAMFRTEAPLAGQVLKNLAAIIKNVATATIGIASPANSKLLLQILKPLTDVMVQLTRNQGLVRTVIYLTLLRSILGKLSIPLFGFSAALRTSFGAGGIASKAVVILTEMSLRTGAAAKASAGLVAALSMLPIWVGPAGAALTVLGFAGLALYGALQKNITATDLYAAAQRRAAGATGFNVSGYEKWTGVLYQHEQQLKRVTRADADQAVGIVAATRLWKAHQVTVAESSVAYGRAQASTERLTSFLSRLQVQFGLTRDGAIRLAVASGVNADSLSKGTITVDAATRKARNYGNQLDVTTGQTNAERIATQNLTTKLDLLNNKLGVSQTSELDWRDAIARATGTLRTNSGTLAVNTQKGRDDRRAIIDATTAALNFASQQVKTGGNIKGASRTIQDQINWLQKHGGKSRWVAGLIDDLRRQERDLRLELQRIKEMKDAVRRVKVYGTGNWTVIGPGGMARAPTYARGGYVRQGSGPTADDVLARVSRGEVIVPTRYVNAGEVDHLRGRIPGFAKGGKIDPHYQDGPRGLGKWTHRNADITTDMLLAAMTSKIVSGLRSVMGSGASVAAFARKFATGNNHPYVWGGMSPAGWDCSGFTSYVYNHFGYGPPRTSEAQYAWGKRSRDQPGALVFFNSPAGGPPPGHVGVSMGNGQMANAAGTGIGTIMSSTHGNMGFRIPPGGFITAGAGGTGGTARESQLAQLWIQAGGPSRLAHLMAAIAMAESGGRADARNPSGATGLWQILGPVNPADGPYLTIPRTNAREAVLKWQTQGLSAWSAYTNGSYRKFMAGGGVIREPVEGIGLRTGASYKFGERGDETVIPGGNAGGDLQVMAKILMSLLAEMRRLNTTVAQVPRATGSEVGRVINGSSRAAALSR